MLRVRTLFAFFALFMALWSGVAAAATQEEAKALADKAAELLAKEGDKAFAVFDDPKGEFVKGELYIVVTNRQGVVLAHGTNPKLIGKNMWEAEDPDGVKFEQEGWKAVEHADAAWISYKFTNPATKKIELKKTYVRKVGDYGIRCGVYVKS